WRQDSEKLRRRNPAGYAFRSWVPDGLSGLRLALWLPAPPRRNRREKRGIAPGQMPRRCLRARGLVELFRQISALRREGADRFEIGVPPVAVAAAVTEFRRAQGGEIIGAAG